MCVCVSVYPDKGLAWLDVSVYLRIDWLSGKSTENGRLVISTENAAIGRV